jgi:hypothetical protein
MDPKLLETFQYHIGVQCKFMVRAAIDVSYSIQINDVLGIFYGLQNILGAGANISKALWGQRGNRATQRKPLRDSLGVSDLSSLKSTGVRNHFEHFDHRLETWWNDLSHRTFVRMSVGPRSSIQGLEVNDFFRHYDPYTTIFYVCNEEIEIKGLINEAQSILSKLRTGSNKFRL